jgi:hypothetical protein
MKHRIYLFTLEADPSARPWVVGLFQAFGTGGAEAESLNCNTPLVSAIDPTGPVVAKCCSTVITDDTLSALLKYVDLGLVPPGVFYSICDEIGPNEGIVTHCNYDPTVIGLRWYTEYALERVGMQFKPSDVLV